MTTRCAQPSQRLKEKRVNLMNRLTARERKTFASISQNITISDSEERVSAKWFKFWSEREDHTSDSLLPKESRLLKLATVTSLDAMNSQTKQKKISAD